MYPPARSSLPWLHRDSSRRDGSIMTYTEFSTTSLDPSERLAYWNRVGSEMYREQLEIIPRPDSAFGASLRCQSYGCLTIARVITTPATVHSQPWDTRVQDGEYAGVVLQDTGTIVREMANRRTLYLPGTATVSCQRQPYTLNFDDTARCIGVWLPVDRLAQRIGDPARLVGMRVEATDAALLANFLRTVTTQTPPAQDPGYDEAIVNVILNLIAITYQHRTAPAATDVVHARWQQVVLDLVERHLDDPELGAPTLAHQLGVTPGEVQVVFAQIATTASEYIRRRRLELPLGDAAASRSRRLHGPLVAPRPPAVQRPAPTSGRRRSS